MENTNFCLFSFAVWASLFFIVHNTCDATELQLNIGIGNYISLEHHDYKQDGIDLFIGAPLSISVSLQNKTALNNYSEIYRAAVSFEMKQQQVNKIKGVRIGTRENSWKTCLTIYLYPSEDDKENLFQNKSALEFESPSKSENNQEILKHFSTFTVFRIPKEVTKTLLPGKYKLFIVYDNTNILEKNGQFEHFLIKSNVLDFELKEPISNIDKAQVLIHEANLYIAKNDYAAIETLSNEAITICEEFPTPYFYLGSVYFDRGDFQNSMQMFKKFIEVVQTTTLEYWASNEFRRNYEIATAEEKINFIKEILKRTSPKK